MKKLIIFSFLLIVGFTSCEILDVEPKQSLSSEVAIKDVAGVKRAINGCYSSLQATGHYGRYFSIVGDMVADNLAWTGTTIEYNQFLINQIETDNSIVEDIWASNFDCINQVNDVLDKMQNVDLTDDEKKSLEAELYFIRALCYFDLVRYFGGVPIRTKPASGDDLEGLNIGRSSVEEVYTFIIDDFQNAEEGLPSSSSSYKASSFAAKAMLAKVYLTKYSVSNSSTDLDLALQYADDVINNSGNVISENFEAIFAEDGNSEIIFEIEFNVQDRNRIAEYFFPNSMAGRYEIAPSQNLIDAFDPSDLRFNSTIDFDVDNNPYGKKFRDISAGTDNVPVVRMAEMYLIKAEVINLKQGDISEIQSNINVIRNRAGLLSTNASNYQDLATEIELQRRLEFAFEGLRWFDLIRTSRAIDVVETVTSVNQMLFPIPINELLTNTNSGMTQNPGY